MAGVACVEQILQARAAVRNHDFRRRDARQLQPHPAVVGARGREVGRRDRAQPARVVPAQRHPPARSACASSTSIAELQDRHRRRRQRHAYDTLLLATGSSRVHAADRGLDKEGRVRVPHARRHARAARARRARREGRGHRRRTARPRGRARPAGAGLRRHRRAPDGDADGTAARSGRRRLPQPARWKTSASACCWRAARRRLLGNGRVEGVAFADGTMHRSRSRRGRRRHPAERRSWPARPASRSTAASSSTTTWRRRDPDIFAVGECVEHRGICYGLVAPLLEQGKVLAATITGNKGPTYTGTVPAAKLKIMGVDVFSAGDWSEQHGASRCASRIRALGIYKKLTVRDGKLAGVILVGDTSDSHRYMDWLRTATDLTGAAPPPAVSAAGVGRGPRRRADVRQRDDLRLRRRHQGRHHPGHSRARASTRCRS